MPLYPLWRKKVGVVILNQVQQDFCDLFVGSGLMEVKFKTGEFTWTNRRVGFSNIVEKLDCFFLAGNWMSKS